MNHIKRYYSLAILVIIANLLVAQDLVYDVVVLCDKSKCDSITIGNMTLDNIVQIYGEGKISQRKVKFSGHVNKPIYAKHKLLSYENLGLEFTFASPFVQRFFFKKTECTLHDISIFNNSTFSINRKLALNSNRTFVEEIYLEDFDPDWIYKKFSNDIIYIKSGLNIIYHDSTATSTIELIFIEESDSTNRKNVEIMKYFHPSIPIKNAHK